MSLETFTNEFFKQLGHTRPPYALSGRFPVFGMRLSFAGRFAGTPPKTAPQRAHFAREGFLRRYIIVF